MYGCNTDTLVRDDGKREGARGERGEGKKADKRRGRSRSCGCSEVFYLQVTQFPSPSHSVSAVQRLDRNSHCRDASGSGQTDV